jgi:hypothetical protein
MNSQFISPEEQLRREKEQLRSNDGWLLFAGCPASMGLAHRVKATYDEQLKLANDTRRVPILEADDEFFARFGDSETRIRVPKHIDGSNIFIFQSFHRKQLVIIRC